jgi:hypothetical protein
MRFIVKSRVYMSSTKVDTWKVSVLSKCIELEEEFEDTKGVSRIRNSKDRQHNGQTKKN